MLQLLILLLAVLVTSGTECPTMCICKRFPRQVVPTNYLYYTAVRCEGGFNSSAPLSNCTRILEVSNLDETSFSELFRTLSESEVPELNTLVLTQSVVGNVSDLLHVAGEQLKFLSLTHDGLTIIPDLTDNLSVISLDLSSNEITILPSYHSLQTIRTLEILNLSVNYIRQIEPYSFQNLTALKVLDLSQNKLISLDSKALNPLKSLQYLNLSHNRIEMLNNECFYGLAKLQQLDVSWNNLGCVTPGSLQLPSLVRLLLAGNSQLGGSYEVLVGVGQKVHTVDASRTGLKQVPAALTRSIRTLRLAGNFIKIITCGELDAYPLLQFLDITSNNIESIDEDALGRLESLSALYLSDNKLRYIPGSLPEELGVLHLERNGIEQISRDDLYGLTNLEVLLLNNNKITVVEGGAFSYLHSLVTLDLSRNPIKALYPGSLSGPSALQILRLSGIDTVSPAEDVSFPLSAPDHLVSLDLSGSSGLARQLLADTAALAASRELQELDVSGADLEFIRSDLLHFLPQLRIMHVEENRLNCSNLQWLALWMRRQDHVEYESITCASPPELWGTPLLDLQYAEIFPITQINHEKVYDSKGTINLEREATAAQKNSPLGKHVTRRIADTSAHIINGFINSTVDTKTTQVVNKTTLASSIRNQMHYSQPERENDVSGNQNANTAGDFNDNTQTKQTITKKKINLKGANKTFVISADIGDSSFVPVSNGLNEYLATKTTLVRHDLDQAGSTDTKATTSDSRSAHKSQTSLNTAPNERIFNATSGSMGNRKSEYGLKPLSEANMTDNMLEWNASTVKTSMYRNNEDPTTRLLHPGMIILAVGVLCGAVTLATLAARFNHRKRRTDRSECLDDIPVTSISSITELW